MDVDKALDYWWGEADVAISNIAIINAYEIYRKHHLRLCKDNATRSDDIGHNRVFQVAFFLRNMGAENLKMFLAKAWDDHGKAINLKKLKNSVLWKEDLGQEPLAKDLKRMFAKFDEQFKDQLKTIKEHRNTWLAHFGREQVQETNRVTLEPESTTIKDMLIMSNETIVLIHQLMCANSKPRGVDPKIVELQACLYWQTIFGAQKYDQPVISYHDLVPESMRTPRLTPLVS